MGINAARKLHSMIARNDAHDECATRPARAEGDGRGGRAARDGARGGIGRARTLVFGVAIAAMVAIPVAEAVRRVGTPFNDVLEGTNGADALFGLAGNDRLFGYGGNDRLEGGADDDQLMGGAGADVLDGGPGMDIVRYYNSNAGVRVNLSTGAAHGGHAQGDTFSGIESVDGSQYDDHLVGDDNHNQFWDSSGNDLMEGRGGNDAFWSGAGADRILGGDGRDHVAYSQSNAGVTVNLATGAAFGGYARGDTLTSIESIYGSNFADRLTGDDDNNYIYGSPGADVLDGGPGNDYLVYFFSQAGVTVNLATGAASGGYANGDTFAGFERLRGSQHNDRLTGDDGDNFLVGGAGADVLEGGEGVDYLGYWDSTAAVTVNLATGAATGGYASGDTFSGIEWIEGSRYDDHLTGDDGDNWMWGNAGNDRLVGGDGNDSFWPGAGADSVQGGAGRDHLSYFHSEAGVTVNLATGAASGGDAEGDTFTSIESVYGSRHADRLTGDDGDNRLYGGAGSDVLHGGEGNDYLSYYDSTAAVTVNLATGAASGGYANGDTFSEFEWVDGSSFDDRLTGDGGDNVFHGGDGADVLVGGAGVDGITYTNSDAGVTVNLATRMASGGHAEGDAFTGFENLKGSAHADRLTGDDGDNELEGIGGNDHLVGGGGNDTFIFEPENGDDVIEDFADGMDRIDLGAFELPNGFEDVQAVALGQAHTVALFPAASDALGRQGFARVINHSEENAKVRIDAYDDSGTPFGPLTLTIGAGETIHFNSDDLEQGNPGKRLEGDTGDGEGPWRLELASAQEIEVLSYVRTEDGFLTSMHDLVPQPSSEHRVVTFNPGKNVNQLSRLRLTNLGSGRAEVRIEGIDDKGAMPGSAVTLSLMAGESRTLDARELETGEAEGLGGALGTGSGKWRLAVTSEQPLLVVSLLSSPTGHLTNLSTAPENFEPGEGGTTSHRIPLFPSAKRWEVERVQGFARVINRSEVPGTITIEAIDDEGGEHEPMALEIEAGETIHFNSIDLVEGNPDKELSGGIGEGSGDWRLELSSPLTLEVMSYIRTEDGFLTSIHDLVPETDGGHDVAIFNPGKNVNQVSQLRIMNAGAEDTVVRINGIDDKGNSAGSEVVVSVAAGAARTLMSQELESGGAHGVIGALGTGTGKWRLAATSDHPVEMMSLLKSPTGHVTNLSTTGTGVMSATTTSDVLIDLSAHGGGTILLRDFDLADLDDSDFVFDSTVQQRSIELPAVHALELEDQGASASWGLSAIEVEGQRE